MVNLAGTLRYRPSGLPFDVDEPRIKGGTNTACVFCLCRNAEKITLF